MTMEMTMITMIRDDDMRRGPIASWVLTVMTLGSIVRSKIRIEIRTEIRPVYSRLTMWGREFRYSSKYERLDALGRSRILLNSATRTLGRTRARTLTGTIEPA